MNLAPWKCQHELRNLTPIVSARFWGLYVLYQPRIFVFWVWAPPFNRYSARSKDKTSAASVDSVTPCWTQLNQLAESPTRESTFKKDVFAVKICKRALSHHWKYSTKMCTCKNDVFDAKICKRALVASTEGYLAVAASTPTYDTLHRTYTVLNIAIL